MYLKTCRTNAFKLQPSSVVFINRNVPQQSSNDPPTVENDYVMPPKKTRKVEDPAQATSSVWCNTTTTDE